MVGGQVPHQTDQGGMFRAETQKLPQPRSPVELEDLLAILKFKVRHERWTSLDMGAQELPMITPPPCEYFHGRAPTKSTVGQMIVQPRRVRDCKCP